MARQLTPTEQEQWRRYFEAERRALVARLSRPLTASAARAPFAARTAAQDKAWLRTVERKLAEMGPQPLSVAVLTRRSAKVASRRRRVRRGRS